MSVTDIEKIAASGGEMPQGLNAPEQLLFLSLRHLYAVYRSGKVDKNTAKKEKTQIIKAFEINSLNEKCYEQTRKIQREFSAHSHDIHTSGCDICRKLSLILTGIGGNEINE